MQKILLCILFSGIASSVWASCDNASNSVEIRECLNAESKIVERRLAQTYKTVLATHNNDTQYKQLIIQAQREWVKFKEADCKAQAYIFQGGSGYGISYLACVNEYAKQRENTLRKEFLGR